jgi:HSP20 family molecular chaperone IbpA
MSSITHERPTREIQVSVKREMKDAVEPTRPGPVFTPAVDILETDEAITILADMPGVRPEDLAIDLRDSTLTLVGHAREPVGEQERYLLREYETGSFYRQFRLSGILDQTKIDASLTQGVLRLVLPKAEAARPRRIQIRAD